ncbi:MAG: response regulator [Bdellovibrionaceae bacterium]|nr:response regulator [Pseudobdellovibrionaceae bacterium]
MASKILICDDAGFVREILRQALMELGYDVVGEARDGTEALESALTLKPDLVLLDLVLPLRNGVEVARDIRERLPGCALVAMSTVEEDFLKQKASAAGFDAWLAKPFTKAQLKEVLSRFSDRRLEVQNG